MQKLIAKYVLAAHLAILAVAPLFLSSEAVIWLALPAIIWILMEPSRVANESLHEARERVVVGMIKDPLFWVMLLLAATALVRALNGGVAFAYDAEHRVWSLTSPVIAILPGCVDGCGFAELGGVVALAVAVIGALHALGRSARLAFLIVASILSAVGATVWLWAYAEGAESAVWAAQTSLTKPLFTGTFFGMALAAGELGLLAVLERGWLKMLLPVMLAVTANALGLFVFAPPLTVAIFAAVALLILVYAFVYLRVMSGGVFCFKFLVLFGVPLVIAGFVATMIVPPELLAEKIAPFMSGDFLPEKMMALRSKLDELSLRMWKSHPWLGTGEGSYALNLGYVATPGDWEIVPAEQTAPLNGFWMLLVERGTIGAFLAAVPLALLVWVYCRRLARAVVRRGLPHPVVIGGLLALAAAATQTAFDSSLLMTGMFTLVMAFFTISTATLPKETKENGR